MTITIRISGPWKDTPLHRFQFTSAVAKFADEAGPVIRDELKAKAPVASGPNAVRPGRLRDAIRYSRSTTAGDTLKLEFSASPPYTKWVIGGTKPHLIEAVAARSLHFFDSAGGERFPRSVHHPGTQPNRFPRRALDSVQPEVTAMFRRTMLDAFT